MTTKPPPPSKQPESIQSMFASISGSYDFLNHFLSGGIDVLWRRRAAKDALASNPKTILDLACGTGDLTLELHRRVDDDVLVVGGDFTHAMVTLATRKRPSEDNLLWIDADGMRLPFPDNTFDLVTIAFGIRNMVSLSGALEECHRVLAPGGRLVILEFSHPTNPIFRAVYMPYFKHVLPRLGAVITRQPAYRYLSDSVLHFPGRKELARIMQQAGFRRVRHRALTFGIAAIHIGSKSRPR